MLAVLLAALLTLVVGEDYSWYRKKGKYNIVPQKPSVPGDCVGAKQCWHTPAQSLAYRICWRITGHVLTSSMSIIYVRKSLSLCRASISAGVPIPHVSENNADPALHPSYRRSVLSFFVIDTVSRLLDPCLCALTLVQFLRFENLVIIVSYVMPYNWVIDCFCEAWFY